MRQLNYRVNHTLVEWEGRPGRVGGPCNQTLIYASRGFGGYEHSIIMIMIIVDQSSEYFTIRNKCCMDFQMQPSFSKSVLAYFIYNCPLSFPMTGSSSAAHGRGHQQQRPGISSSSSMVTGTCTRGQHRQVRSKWSWSWSCPLPPFCASDL